MEKIKKLIDYVLLGIYVIFISMFVGFIFIKATPKYMFSYIIVTLLIIGLIIFLRKNKKIFTNRKMLILLAIVVALFAIGIRMYIVKLNYISPYSDYATFYNNAAYFSENTKFLYTDYIALFPYLSGYIIALGTFFKMIAVSYTNAIIFNVIFDLLSALLLFLTFRKKSLPKAILLALSWLINPINIIWCTFVSPVVIVNFFVVLALCMIESFEKDIIKPKRFIIYNIVLGIILALGNQFRPIFIIFIIALFIYRVYRTMFEKNIKKSVTIISLIVLTCFYVFVDKTIFCVIEKINVEKCATTQGWAIYVGANINSSGAWNLEDSQHFSEINHRMPAEDAQQQIKKEAIERYKNNGIISNIRLMKNKTSIMMSSLGKYSSSCFNYIQDSYNNEKLDKYIEIICCMMCFIIVFSNIIIVAFRKNIKDNMIYILMSIGIIMAHLLVEVSERYSIQAYIPLQILATIMFVDILNKDKIFDK